jgi:hypothetical protein
VGERSGDDVMCDHARDSEHYEQVAGETSTTVRDHSAAGSRSFEGF